MKLCCWRCVDGRERGQCFFVTAGRELAEMEGAAPIWFCKRGGCPLLLVAEGKKKIKGSGEVCEGCSGSWTTVERKKKEREGCLQETGQKSLFCANFELLFCQPLEHEN